MRFSVQNEFNVVGHGDSMTAERSALGGATVQQTYPALMAGIRGFGNYVNTGISGQRTDQLLARFTADVLVHHAGCISIMGGANDWTTNISGGAWVGGGTSSATTKANLKSMVQAGQASRARVTLLTPVPVFDTVYINNVADWITKMGEVATETGCAFVDVYSAFIALPTAVRNSYLLDNQHPNAVGHAYIASLCVSPAFSQA